MKVNQLIVKLRSGLALKGIGLLSSDVYQTLYTFIFIFLVYIIL